MIFETDQQTSLRTAFFGWVIKRSRAYKAPAFIAAYVCESSPVNTLPIVRRQDTAIASVGCSSSCTTLVNTPHSIMRGIALFPLSEMYDIAQQMSPIISSWSFWIKTRAREGKHRFTFWMSGAGRPLQKFDKVQLAFLVNDWPVWTWSSRSAIGSTAPAAITISRILGPSPAIFPMPQIACSITSIWGDFSSLIS